MSFYWNVIENGVSREQTPQEKAIFTVCSPFIYAMGGLAVAGEKINEHRIAQKLERKKAKKELKRIKKEHKAREREYQIRYQARLQFIEDFDSRVETLLTMSPSNGDVCVISKSYPNGYTSVWTYSVTSEGYLTRRRPWDKATVVFSNITSMRDDFLRYERHGFRFTS